jgi:hypothetical protein
MEELVVSLRMLERITVVLIGGIAIFLGYRLFFNVPYKRDHEGQLELPGVKIVLSRVGPGIFFAAFGSIVLFYSLTQEVKLTWSGVSDGSENERQVTERPVQTSEFIGASTEGTGNKQEQTKALTTIEMLNCTQRLILKNKLAPELDDDISLAISDAKRALMLSVWNADSWGSPDQFKVSGLSTNLPFELRSMLKSTYAGCPQ